MAGRGSSVHDRHHSTSPMRRSEPFGSLHDAKSYSKAVQTPVAKLTMTENVCGFAPRSSKISNAGTHALSFAPVRPLSAMHLVVLKAFEPRQHDVAETQRVWENESAVWFVYRPKIAVGVCCADYFSF